MRIGWRQFIKSKFQSKSAYSAVGISLAVDTACFCALKDSPDGITIAHYHEAPIGSWHNALATWVSDNRIGNAACGVSIATQLHSIFQIEKPAVEAEEIHKALTWPVKEMAGSDAPELVFDYFEAPVQSSGANNLNVIALPRTDLEKVIDAALNAGLSLNSVVVEDLAICDLIDTEEAVITILQRAGEEIQLAIVKQGQLYFSRSLKGFENLGSFSIDELQMGVLDSLTVQIQRSMDYFESQLRQAPIRKIFMNIESANSHAIAGQIKDLMQIDVQPFSPNIQSDSIGLDSVDFSCLGAAYSILNAPATITEQSV